MASVKTKRERRNYTPYRKNPDEMSTKIHGDLIPWVDSLAVAQIGGGGVSRAVEFILREFRKEHPEHEYAGVSKEDLIHQNQEMAKEIAELKRQLKGGVNVDES